MSRVPKNSPYYHLSIGGLPSQAQRDARAEERAKRADSGASDLADMQRRQHKEQMALFNQQLAAQLEILESSLRNEKLLERLLAENEARTSRRKVSNAVDSFNWEKFMDEREKEARELLQIPLEKPLPMTQLVRAQFKAIVMKERLHPDHKPDDHGARYKQLDAAKHLLIDLSKRKK